MRDGTFNYSSLEKACKRLGEVIVRYNNDNQDDALRDAVIQRFEFTYALTLKIIRKYFIDRAFIIEDINQMSFNDMIRNANQLGILKSNLEVWTNYRQMRNLTSHTYNEDLALKVVSVVPDFYEEVLFLLKSLKD